jgi:hypothetical protein
MDQDSLREQPTPPDLRCPVVRFSLHIMLILSAANSAMAFLPSWAIEHNVAFMGPLFTGLLFLFCGVGMLFVGRLARTRISFGAMLAVGSLGYAVYVSSAALIGLAREGNLWLITAGVVLGGTLAGLSAALLYFSQGYYVTLTQDSSLAGLSFMIIQTANLVGCLTNWALIHFLPPVLIFLCTGGDMVLISLTALCIPDIPRKQSSE